MSVRINIRLPEDIHKDCQAYIQNKGITLTDMIVDGLRLQVETPETRPCTNKPKVKKSSVKRSGGVACEPEQTETPISQPDQSIPVPVYIIKHKDDIDMEAIKARYKVNHPLLICSSCHSYNRDCTCESFKSAKIKYFSPVRG